MDIITTAPDNHQEDGSNSEYYDNYGSFESYIETTQDPGPWILVGVTLYSVLCLVILPVLVLVQNKRAPHPKNQQDQHSHLTKLDNENIIIRCDCHEEGMEAVLAATAATSSLTTRESVGSLVLSEPPEKTLFQLMIAMARIDHEFKAILRLGIPLTLSEISGAIYYAVTVALISRNLGVDALSAYVITNLLIGLVHTFISGLGYALNTVCSHAIGCGNYKLAGQYVQISLTLYVACSIPLLSIWYFVMDDCLELFGVNDNVIKIGTEYTKVVVLHYLMAGIFGTFRSLLDVSGYALYATIMDIVSQIIQLVVLGVLLKTTHWMTLYYSGLIKVLITFVCTGGFIVLAFAKGWLQPYQEGLFHTVGWKNTLAVKNIVMTAIPLGFGVLLEYAEWEALTVLAAVLGPAEVAAWAIMGSIWNAFESATGGLSEAGSIRVAHHLGRGDIESAKSSTWKTLFISTMLALVITSILFLCGNSISAWFTDDTTLQRMLNDLIPLIGLGNILMVFGMISWSLIGAQGRYHLATIINTVMSICVTLPIAIIFTVVCRFTLEGLVGAVIIGYSSTGLTLGYLLLITDWPKVSKLIQEQNAESSDDESVSNDSFDINSQVHGVISTSESDLCLLDDDDDDDEISYVSEESPTVTDTFHPKTMV